MSRPRVEHVGRKVSIYLPEDVAERLKVEEKKYERSASWLIRRACVLLFEELDRRELADRARVAQERSQQVQAGMGKG